jgi:hypothetical protein
MNNKKYSFLLEYGNQFERPHISVTGILKPLSIGSLTNIVKAPLIYIQKKVNYQISRINNLISELQQRINNPKYEKVQENNKFELDIVRQAFVIHNGYFRKILTIKRSGRLKNVAYISRMETLYKRQLFTLSQKYKKYKLQQRMTIQQAQNNSTETISNETNIST